LAVAQHLPQGRYQAGDRHLNFHKARDNLCGGASARWDAGCLRDPSPPCPETATRHAVKVGQERATRMMTAPVRVLERNLTWCLRLVPSREALVGREPEPDSLSGLGCFDSPVVAE